MQRFNLGKGTVLQFLDDAGVLRKRRRHIADHLDEAEHLYIEEQWSLQQIGQHLGFASGTIYRHLKQRGVVMRRPWSHLQT
jgi:IS30 family transposase